MAHFTPYAHDAYIVIFEDAAGDMFANETHFPGADRAKFVADLWAGHYDTATIDTILRMNIAAGTVVNVTEEIAQAVADLSFIKRDRPADEAKALCDRLNVACFESFDAEAA